MYLNGIKHNVVTKLNPLTLNVGLDRWTDEGHFYNPPSASDGGLQNIITTKKKKKKNRMLYATFCLALYM